MKPTIDQIVAAAARRFYVYKTNITGFSRVPEYTRPRFAVYAIAHDVGFSYRRIGRALGGRDNTSVSAGKLRALELAETDPDFAATYAALRIELLGSARGADGVS